MSEPAVGRDALAEAFDAMGIEPEDTGARELANRLLASGVLDRIVADARREGAEQVEVAVEAVLMRWSEEIVRLPFDERIPLRRARIELRAALTANAVEADRA